MACSFVNNPTQIAEAVRAANFSMMVQGEIKTQQDLLNVFDGLQESFTTSEIPTEQLKNTKLRQATKKKSWSAYKLVDQDLFIEERFTTEGSLKFEKMKGLVISEAYENIIKREAGTSVHEAIEMLLGNEILSRPNEVMTRRNIKSGDDATIMEQFGITQEILTNLKQYAKYLVDNAVAAQKEINPDAKVLIAPEQKLIDVYQALGSKRSNVRMGTADLVVVFSDMTYKNYDFKTKVPKFEDKTYDKKTKTYTIKNKDWIPFYSYADWNMQLTKSQHALEKVMGLGKSRGTRIIPFHIEFNKGQDGKIQEKLKSVYTPLNNPEMIKEVAINETTGNLKLDEAIRKLKINKSNYEAELAEAKTQEKRNDLKQRINDINLSINDLIVDRDYSYLLEAYNSIIKRVADREDGKLVLRDISNPESVTYMELEEIRRLIEELESVSVLIATTKDFYASTDVRDKIEIEEKRKSLLDDINTIIEKLKDERYAAVNKTSDNVIDSLQGMKEITFLSKEFTHMSDMDNAAIAYLNKEAYKAQASVEQRMVKFQKEYEKVIKGLQEYGNSQGLKGIDIFKPLINESTRNLHAKFNSNFYEMRKNAIENQDISFVEKYYKLKDDAVANYEERKAKFIAKEKIDKSNIRDTAKLERWIANNSPANITSFTLSFYYELNETAKDFNSELGREIYNPDYINIQNNQGLKDFYDFWVTNMQEVRESLGKTNNYSELPDNLIPWIRRNTAEFVLNDGFSFKAVRQMFDNMFKLQQDEQMFGNTYDEEIRGKINPNTGEPYLTIPVWGIDPLRNTKGDIDPTLKTLDLGSSMYLLLSMAENYKQMSAIEGKMNTIADAIADFGVYKINPLTKTYIFKDGQPVRISGTDTKAYKAYSTFVERVVYGKHLKEQETLGKKGTDAVLKANRLAVKLALAVNPVSQLVAYEAAKLNAKLEARKNYYFSRKHLNNAEKMWLEASTAGKFLKFASPNSWITQLRGKSPEGFNSVLYASLIHFFEPADKSGRIKAGEVSQTNISKQMDRGLSMIGFRKGSEKLRILTLLAMLQNYKIVDNELVRKVGEDEKSIIDTATIDDNGNLIIPGLVDANGLINLDILAKIKNTNVGLFRNISGETSGADINAVSTTMQGKLLMTFKSWLPAMARERFLGVNLGISGNPSAYYDRNTEDLKVSRFAALRLTEREEGEAGFINFMKHTAAFSLRLATDMATFGYLKNSKIGMKLSEERARAVFEKFKEDNRFDPVLSQIQDFESFKEYAQGQIRAGVTELRMYAGLIALVFLAGLDYDDDDEADLKQYWLGRQVFRVANKVTREIGFFYGSEGFDILTNNVLPITSLLTGFSKMLKNTADQLTDDIFGQDSEKDKTGRFYYTTKMILYLSPFSRFIELTEQDKQINL
jgi:hypothetical protein